MKLSNILATLMLVPALAESYGLGFYNPGLIRPMVLTQGRAAAAARRARSMMDGYTSSPRYEVTDNDQKFQVAVDVPGVKAEDIEVSLEDGMLTLRGQRQSTNEQYQFSSKFSQSFGIDAAVDVDKITANLQNGVLIVSAPKDMRRLEANIKIIPVVEGAPEVSKAATMLEPDQSDSHAEDNEDEVLNLDSIETTSGVQEDNTDKPVA